MLNLLLTLSLFWLFSAGSGAIAPACAQEAMPVAAVDGETLAPPDAPVVIELFSSQACVFCPAADRLFADLTKRGNVIGLACHVDYFDVKEGSLAKPFCTGRQNWYMDRLHAGPNYTPQMVVQGSIDAVGYKTDDVEQAIKKGQLQPLTMLTIAPGQAAGSFDIRAPEGATPAGNIYLMVTDKPHDLTVAEGGNKNQKMIYYNIVSGFEDLGPWPAGLTSMTVKPELGPAQKGFTVLVQDSGSGKIMAAGTFSR